MSAVILPFTVESFRLPAASLICMSPLTVEAVMSPETLSITIRPLTLLMSASRARCGT